MHYMNIILLLLSHFFNFFFFLLMSFRLPCVAYVPSRVCFYYYFILYLMYALMLFLISVKLYSYTLFDINRSFWSLSAIFQSFE